MNYSQFIIKMKENLQEKLGVQAKVEAINVPKNNGIMLQGITIRRPGERVVPTIYLERFYEDYLEGRDLEDILEDFIEIYEEQETTEFPDFDFYQDYEKVKKCLALKLVNREKNAEMLRDMPHKYYLDMAVVFYCLVERHAPGAAAIAVKNAHMEKWGVSPEKMYEDALENAENMLPGRIRTMEDLLGALVLEESRPGWEWTGQDPEDFPGLEGVPEKDVEFKENPLLVLTNERRYLGASCILYRGLLKRFAGELGNNFYILPSSIHEVILLPENRVKNAENLIRVVMEVNRTQLAPEEVLSGAVYYYNRETGKISIYDGKPQN